MQYDAEADFGNTVLSPYKHSVPQTPIFKQFRIKAIGLTVQITITSCTRKRRHGASCKNMAIDSHSNEDVMMACLD